MGCPLLNRCTCVAGGRGGWLLVMGDRLNFIIDHQLEPVDAFDAILPIIIGSHIFTELSTFYALEGNSGASGFFLCPCVKGNNWFYYITLGKTYCQSSRRLSVSETSLPCGLVVHINLVIACFVQASDDRLLKMRIDHHNQQLLPLINQLFPIIRTSLVVTQKVSYCAWSEPYLVITTNARKIFELWTRTIT